MASSHVPRLILYHQTVSLHLHLQPAAVAQENGPRATASQLV